MAGKCSAPASHSVAAEPNGPLIVRPTESVLRGDRVCVQPKRFATFQSTRIPVNAVEYDGPSKFRFLHLVGRNATTDSAGNATVTW